MNRSQEVEMDIRPCSTDPDLWFGYADDDASDGAAKARAYEQSATRARIICLRRCPLAQQRSCALQAVQAGEEYGVWAGIKLPGGQYRKRHELGLIAEGLVNPRQLPESAELLSRADTPAAPEPAVVHLTVGRPPAAA
jgi:WhiB family redox-sensing transcriptional regulator